MVAGILAGIGGLIAVTIGGVSAGLIVFIVLFLLLAGAGTGALIGSSSTAIIILIALIIVFKLAKGKG